MVVGFGSAFGTPINTKGKDLIVQYEVKLDSFQCGGAYIKLPRASDTFDISKLDNDTPYTIMFGPDRCGSSNKVHFILQHENPISHVWEEKHFTDPTMARLDRNTHLYTLAVYHNNSFEVYVDMELEKSGDLLTNMEPPVNPSKTIDDPTDSKPSDWVDAKNIFDPSAVKPDDWDEEAPMMIVDTADTKPAGWLDDAPKQIPDPEAARPSDWDDEEVR
jgi:calnexin